MAFDAIHGDIDTLPPRARAARGGGAMAKVAGSAAENAVLRRYRKGGATPLAQNWHAKKVNGGGEIDLIVERGGTVIFIEVKARRTLAEAYQAIRNSQLRRVMAAAEGFMSDSGRWGGDMRFDIVLCDRYGAMEKIENVWID
ncbi:MAG: putative endonuclease [Paracoccaceae bacterium]|jgi:putative endonuclease